MEEEYLKCSGLWYPRTATVFQIKQENKLFVLCLPLLFKLNYFKLKKKKETEKLDVVAHTYTSQHSRGRADDLHETETSLNYRVRSCLKENKIIKSERP